MERYLCWFAHGEPYVPHETIVERMVESTSSSSNVHEVVDDNSNPYRNMVMDAMRMNQGYIGQCSIIDKETNVDMTRFFDFLKDFNEPLWDGCIIHSKLSSVAQVFTVKSDHRLSEVSYGRTFKWARNILL
jgi:hypothetical protein